MIKTLSKTQSLQKKALEEELASLSKQYIAVTNQRNLERNERDRILLKEQANKLLEEMNQVETELKQIENSENNPNYAYLAIEANLPEIDFQEALEIVQKILKSYFTLKEGGQALFLIEDSYSFAGELCISRIREQFSRQTRETNFRHLKIEITSLNSFDKTSLLRLLADYFNIEDITEEAIITKICKSLRNGSIVFLEIKRWECIQEQKKNLYWFINNFWSLLIDQCRAIVQQEKLLEVKLIAVIDAETVLDECSNLPCYCTLENFDSKKILKLRLNTWSEEDIYKWIARYGNLPNSELIESMAKRVYQKALRQGIPSIVRDALEKELHPYSK